MIRPLDILASLLGCLAFVLWQGQPKAAELILHTVSYHFDREADYNNFNPGISYRFDNEVIVGTFYNSIRRESFYAGYRIKLPANFSVVVGGVTGYLKYDVWPAAIFTYTVPLASRWNLHINAIPHETSFIHFAIGREL